MAENRPTFSESWYRVAPLCPALRSSVQSYRQHYRGQRQHVLRDQGTNQFFRLNESAYHFIGLLDGQRTVSDVWEICNQQLGDAAPTQPEVIQLLGQLYTANLLQSDLPPDAQGMFDRYRKRVRREVGGYLMNIMFAKIPLFDPERILERWAGAAAWMFSWVGVVVWFALIAVGGWHLVGHLDALISGADELLAWDVEKLVILYLSFAVTKAIHEFGHGFACKTYGQLNHSGGQVHTLGVMLLVGVPVPYVDASSSWAFRSKWQRIIVAAAGIYVELAVAAIAAIIWARTSSDSLAHSVAYNVIFLASVSTILFNANPLLRFDGYYMLSDYLEIPNLSQRAKDYLYYLVKRYAYGVRQAQTNVQGASERPWLVIYALTSTVYRVFISVVILMFIADKLFFVGVLIALVAMIGWVGMPLGKFITYLCTGPQLARYRLRAITLTVGVLGVLIGALGLVPAPQRGRAEGLLEARELAVIYMPVDGFVQSFLPSNTWVTPSESALVVAENRELEAEYQELLAERQITLVRLGSSLYEEPALRLSLEERLAALDERIARVERQLKDLTVHAPFEGQWVTNRADSSEGALLLQGEPIGVMASTDRLLLRVVTDQHLGPRLGRDIQEGALVELRVKGRPETFRHGRIEKIIQAGHQQLPSAAMGHLAGGTVLVADTDGSGTRTVEPFFEVLIGPAQGDASWTGLLAGQRVVVRFDMEDKPLGIQWWRSLQQLLQSRFGI